MKGETPSYLELAVGRERSTRGLWRFGQESNKKLSSAAGCLSLWPALPRFANSREASAQRRRRGIS